MGDLPAIAHSYEGVFSAAGTGALSGVVTSKLSGGWWDGTVDAGKQGPVMELQAINAEARASLCDVVLRTLKSAFKTYAPAVGQEAEQAQNLFAIVAENATREWLLETRAAANAAAAAGGLEEDLDEEGDAIDEEMCARAGTLAAQLVNYYEVELPGSKSALYVNLLTHMAGLSRSRDSVFEVEDGEMAEAAIELASAAKERRDEGTNFSMAAVSVSVLEDAMMRVAEAVASACLSRVREGVRAGGDDAGLARARGGQGQIPQGRPGGAREEERDARRRLVRVQGCALRALGSAQAQVHPLHGEVPQRGEAERLGGEELPRRGGHVRGLALSYGSRRIG